MSESRIISSKTGRHFYLLVSVILALGTLITYGLSQKEPGVSIQANFKGRSALSKGTFSRWDKVKTASSPEARTDFVNGCKEVDLPAVSSVPPPNRTSSDNVTLQYMDLVNNQLDAPRICTCLQSSGLDKSCFKDSDTYIPHILSENSDFNVSPIGLIISIQLLSIMMVFITVYVEKESLFNSTNATGNVWMMMFMGAVVVCISLCCNCWQMTCIGLFAYALLYGYELHYGKTDNSQSFLLHYIYTLICLLLVHDWTRGQVLLTYSVCRILYMVATCALFPTAGKTDSDMKNLLCLAAMLFLLLGVQDPIIMAPSNTAGSFWVVAAFYIYALGFWLYCLAPDYVLDIGLASDLFMRVLLFLQVISVSRDDHNFFPQ